MKPSAVNYFVCPHCGSGMDLTVTEVRDSEILEGLLRARNQCVYTFPVTRGVPRLLSSDRWSTTQHQTQDSFSDKWTRAPNYRKATGDFYTSWFLSRYGFDSLETLSRFLAPMRFILDAGTGTGRDAQMYAACSRADVFAIDLSRGIDVAYADLGHISNLHLIQADLRELPFPRDFFDVVACDQVLHHTGDPKDSLRRLLAHLKPHGHVLFYAYRLKGPVREFCDDFIRSRTTEMSDEECYAFAAAMTKLGKALAGLKGRITFAEPIPILDIPAGEYDIQRFFHWHVMKCFWNDDFDWLSNVIVNYDWYRPSVAYRYSEDEILRWCDELSLKPLRVDVRESGISVMGVKEA